MSRVTVRWAPNTARELEEEGRHWPNVTVQRDDNGEIIYLYGDDGDVVAHFHERDAAVFLVDQ